MVDLLITGRDILTTDDKRRIIKDGAVAIVGNKIFTGCKTMK